MTVNSDSVKCGSTRVRTPACIKCKEHSQVDVRTEDYERWKANEFIQDVWPG